MFFITWSIFCLIQLGGDSATIAVSHKSRNWYTFKIFFDFGFPALQLFLLEVFLREKKAKQLIINRLLTIVSRSLICEVESASFFLNKFLCSTSNLMRISTLSISILQGFDLKLSRENYGNRILIYPFALICELTWTLIRPILPYCIMRGRSFNNSKSSRISRFSNKKSPNWKN